MNWFHDLGIDRNAPEEAIANAFRERLRELGTPPDETQLRRLLDARDQAMASNTQNLPTIANSRSLQLAINARRDLIQYQDISSQFDRTKKALLSERITPLLRLKTLAVVLSILSAATAALSFDKINPYLEILLQSEFRSKAENYY